MRIRFSLVAAAFLLAACSTSTPGVDSEAGSSLGVACTMDAKQCSDGSYVGRVAPSCEFAPCPDGS